jgi:hypothetical protein
MRGSSLALVGAFALGSFVAGGAAPVQAQFGIVNGLLGGALGGGGYYRHYGYHHRYSSHAHNSNNDDTGSADSDSSDSDSQRALASLAPPSSQDQTAVFKSITPSETLSEVGASNDDQVTGKTDTGEDNRDYTAWVSEVISKISQKYQNSDKGDITEHAILDALTDAILRTKLAKFETFRGENWTAERLRVMILSRVYNQLDEFFEGTQNTVAMSDLTSMINEAARQVHAQLFETSELLAANSASTLFVQRLYQTYGDLKDNVREDTERYLLEAANVATDSFEPMFRRDADAYALHYRAQRIVFDCLSDNVDSITASSSGMASPAEIEKRILDSVKKQCSNWVKTQMLGSDNQLKPQEPVPLAVIWSANELKENDSMYQPATDS